MNPSACFFSSCLAKRFLPMLGAPFWEIPEYSMHSPPPVGCCGTGDPPVGVGIRRRALSSLPLKVLHRHRRFGFFLARHPHTMNTTTPLLLTVLLHVALPLAAQVPQIINYQGKVAVGATPFTGSGQFRFALVDGAGATSFWSNDGTSTAGSQPTASVALPVVNGLYVVPLGDVTIPNMTAVPATAFTNADVRLRVWFNDGTNEIGRAHV